MARISVAYDERYSKLNDILPLNNYNVTKSAIQAGFGSEYARRYQKTIMKNALKHKLLKAQQLEEVKAEITGEEKADAKMTMSERLGISRESLFANVRFIAEQNRDLPTKLKVLTPLAREHGINLDPDEQPNSVPNITFNFRVSGSTEPDKTTEHVAQQLLSDTEAEQLKSGGEAGGA